MIIKKDDVIGKFFKDLSHNPRKEKITCIELTDCIASIFFFSETVSGKGAGVARQFISHGLSTIIDGHSDPDSFTQILSKEDGHTLQLLGVEFGLWVERGRTAHYERRWSDSRLYYNQATAIEKEAAELFNVEIDVCNYKRYREVFTLFPPLPEKPESTVQKIKKIFKKKGPSK